MDCEMLEESFSGALRPYRYNDIVSHVTPKFNPQFAVIYKKFESIFQIGVNTYFSIMPSTTA